MPFPYNSVAAFEFKVRPTRFFHRFAEIEVNNGRDLEVPTCFLRHDNLLLLPARRRLLRP